MYEAEKKECSKILYKASVKTWLNRAGMQGEIETLYKDFSSPRAAVLQGSNTFYISGNADGVVNKIEFAERLSEFNNDFSAYRTLPQDLMAMVCDDAACGYADPFAFVSMIHANDPKIDLVRELAKGYIEAARKSNVAIINGEFAISNRVAGYGKYNYNLDGVAIASFDRGDAMVYSSDHMKRQRDSEDAPKTFLVGIKENGPRANGYTDIKKALEDYYGHNWHTINYEKTNLAELYLEPSVICTPFLVGLCKNLEKPENSDKRFYGAINVSGGGLPEKVGRLMRRAGMGAIINDPWEVPESLLHIQKISKMPDEKAYRTFGMGHACVVATPDAEYVVDVARTYGLEAKTIGMATNTPGIKIKSNGLYSKGETLKF